MVRIHPDPPLLEWSRRTKEYVSMHSFVRRCSLNREDGFEKFFKNSEGNESVQLHFKRFRDRADCGGGS